MAGPCVPVRINHLCCRICSKVLRDPATVPCGHNFCMQCIKDCWDRADRIKCPECGCMFSTRPQLIKNTTLAVLVRDTKKWDNGSEKRKQQDAGASPQVVKKPWSYRETKTPGSTLCGKHNSRRDVYCCYDKLILCAKCAITEHQGHRIVYVKEERRRKQVCKTEILQLFLVQRFKSNMGSCKLGKQLFIRYEQWTSFGKRFVI